MQGLWYVALLAAFASLNSCNLGFDLVGRDCWQPLFLLEVSPAFAGLLVIRVSGCYRRGAKSSFATRSLADAMASPPAAAAVEEAMAWRPPPSPGEEQRVMDRAYAEYVLPDDELNRLRNGGAKSPRKPNGSPPRKAGSARPGSGSIRCGHGRRSRRIS